MEESRDLNVFNMVAADSSPESPSATELMQNAFNAKSHLIELASYINSNPTFLVPPDEYISRIQSEAIEEIRAIGAITAHRGTGEAHHLEKAEVASTLVKTEMDIKSFEVMRESEKQNPDSLFHRIKSFEGAINSYLHWIGNVESKFQEHNVLEKNESIRQYDFSQQKQLLLSMQEVDSVESALRLYAETQDRWDKNHEHDLKSSLVRYAMQETQNASSLKHDH